jgi:hypothetical protein
MNLPPLPLKDGRLLFDNSSTEVITKCPRAGCYQFLHNRISAGEKPALNFGSAMHEVLAFRYSTDPSLMDPMTEQRQLDMLTEFFAAHPPPEGQYRNLDLATSLIKGYNQVYMVEDFDVALHNGKPFIEQPFSITIGEAAGVPIVYCGKIDMGIILDGGLYTMDHKTTFQFGEGFWKDQAVSAQHTGYCWALREMTGQCPVGYVINAIRTRAPLKRKEDGSVSSRAKPREVSEDFERQRFFVDDAKLDEWKTNFLEIMTNFIEMHRAGRMPMHRKFCIDKYGACPYYEVCTLPADQRELYLYSEHFTEQTWSPLNPLSTV